MNTAGFEAAAQTVITGFRNALGEILESLPGQVRRPSEIGKVLGLDKALAWKLAQLVETPDPMVAGRHLPGSSAMRIVTEALRRRGVRADLIARIETAADGVEELVRVHAGDRASLDMMLQGCAPRNAETTDAIDTEHRRAAFRGNSFIWGVQAKVKLTSIYMHPAGAPGMLDIAVLHGFVELRRLRPNVPWLVTRSSCTDGDGVSRHQFHREPLDPASDGQSMPLITPFCSQPLPTFRRIPGAPGYMDEEVVGGAVGSTGALTFFTGEVLRDAAPVRGDEHNTHNNVASAMWTPTEHVVLDLVVHEDVFGPLRPEVKLFGQLGSSAPYPQPGGSRILLPTAERARFLGQGPASLETRIVPRYPEMAAFIFKRLGWDGSRFDVYRTAMRYPPIPATLVMSHELPA